jgi:hypothetical protein
MSLETLSREQIGNDSISEEKSTNYWHDCF